VAVSEHRIPRLVVTQPPGLRGTVLLLMAAELIVCHSSTADLVLEDEFVSRRHALITVGSMQQVSIRHLHSTRTRS
jgi:hypothetical protein